jgi:hypothetical protein
VIIEKPAEVIEVKNSSSPTVVEKLVITGKNPKKEAAAKPKGIIESIKGIFVSEPAQGVIVEKEVVPKTGSNKVVEHKKHPKHADKKPKKKPHGKKHLDEED